MLQCLRSPSVETIFRFVFSRNCSIFQEVFNISFVPNRSQKCCKMRGNIGVIGEVAGTILVLCEGLKFSRLQKSLHTFLLITLFFMVFGRRESKETQSYPLSLWEKHTMVIQCTYYMYNNLVYNNFLIQYYKCCILVKSSIR